MVLRIIFYLFRYDRDVPMIGIVLLVTFEPGSRSTLAQIAVSKCVSIYFTDLIQRGNLRTDRKIFQDYFDVGLVTIVAPITRFHS